MPRRKTQKRKQRKTKRNFKKRGGVGSSSKKRRPSPSLGTRGHIRKKSRTSRQTYAVTAEGQEVDEGSARANEQEAEAVANEQEAEAVAMAAMRIEGPAMVENRLLPMVQSPHAPLMSHGPRERTPLRDPTLTSSKPRRQRRYKLVPRRPTASEGNIDLTDTRLQSIIDLINNNQIRMQKLNIGTDNWERYKSQKAPITVKAAEAFYEDQKDKIRVFLENKQHQEQREHRENKKIMNDMLKKTGKRTSLMTLGLLATLMANNLYKNNPEGIPPYQPAIAATSADIVRKATGNDGLIHVEEMNPSNPNYYRIKTKSGKKINFDPSTTTMEQWHEAKKKAILEQKPFTIYDEQDAVKFFLEQGNKDLLGIALKKISPRQKQLLEQARLDQLIKEEKKQRRHKIRGEKPKYNTKKRNNFNKHNTQFTRRG